MESTLEDYHKDLDFEYTCQTKHNDTVPPPWDRTLDVCWSRFPQASKPKEGKGDDHDLGASMHTQCTPSIPTTGAKPSPTPRPNSPKSPQKGHRGYSCLPEDITLRICHYVVQNHCADKPVCLSRLSTCSGLYPVRKRTLLIQGTERKVWESKSFEKLSAFSPYFRVCRGFRDDLLTTFVQTCRFHLVISPFGPTVDMDWLKDYGPYLDNITLEFDCTRYYGGKPMLRDLDEATGRPGLFDKQQLETMALLGPGNMKDGRKSVEYYKWVLKPVLEHLTAGRRFPIERLTIMVRKYYGSQESMPQGYPYFDPTWLNFLLLIPSELQYKVLSLETIGVPPRLLGLMISKFWGEGKPPTEDAQRQHFRWGPFLPTLWPLMPGQRAAVSVPGSIDPTVDRLLRLDRPGEVVVHPLPKKVIEIRIEEFIDMLQRKKETDQEATGTKKLSSQGEENFRAFALTETEVKSEEEPSSSSGTAVSTSVQAYKTGDYSSAYGSPTRKYMDALLESGENFITALKQKKEESLKESEQLQAELKQSDQLEEQGQQQQQQQPAKKRKSKRKKKKTNKPSIPLEGASVPQPQSHPEPEPRPEPEPQPEPVVEHPDQAEEQPQAQPPSKPSVVAEYLSFFKAKEDEAKAMEQQQQQETQRPRSLYRLLKFIKPGEGEAGPSGRPTTITTESAKAALRTESSSAVGYSRTLVPEEQYLYEDENDGKQKKALHMQRARDRSKELASVLEDFRPVTPPAFPDDLTDIRTLSPQTGVEAYQEPATRYDGFIPLPSPLSFRTPTRPEQPQTLTPLPSKTTSPVPGTGPAALGSPFSIPLPDANRTWLTDEDSQSGSAGSTSDSTSGSSGRSTAVGADTMADGNGKRQALSAVPPATESKPPKANIATGTTASLAAFEDNDRVLELWETEDTACGAEQPWIKVEKKSQHRRSKTLLQKPCSSTNRKLVLPVLNVQTSLQNLQDGWASTAASMGESSKMKTKTTMKHNSKKVESVAAPRQGGSSKKAKMKVVNKKAGKNKGVKSGGDFASGSTSTLKDFGSNVKAVPPFICLTCNKSFASENLFFSHLRELRHWCHSTSVPPRPETGAPSASSSRPTSSEVHIGGSKLDKIHKPGQSTYKAEDRGTEVAIVSGLTAKKAESKTSARTQLSSSVQLRTSKPKMEEPYAEVLSEAVQVVEPEEESSKTLKDAVNQGNLDLKAEEEIPGSQSPPEPKLPPSSQTSLPTSHLSMEVASARPTLLVVPEEGERQSRTRSPPGSASDKPPSPPRDPFSPVEAKMAAEKAKMPVSNVKEISVEKLKEEIEKLKEELSKFQTPPIRVMREVTKDEVVPKVPNGDVKAGEEVVGGNESSSFVSGRDIQDGGIASSMSKAANPKGKDKGKGKGLWTGSPKLLVPLEDKRVVSTEAESSKVKSTKVGSMVASQPPQKPQVPSLQPKIKISQAPENVINQEGKTHGQARAEGFRQGQQREVAATKAEKTKADVKPTSQPQPQLQRHSAEPKNKTFQTVKKVYKEEKVTNAHARTKVFSPPRPQGPQGQRQGQQQNSHSAGPSTSSVPYPNSHLRFGSEMEALAAYHHYKRNKMQALDTLPTKTTGHGGSKAQGSKARESKARGQPMYQEQYSQGLIVPMMSQHSQGSMMSQDQLQPMYQGQMPMMHPSGPVAKMSTMSQYQTQPMYQQGQAPPMPLFQLIHQMATGSREQLMSLMPSMPHTISQAPPLYQVPAVSQVHMPPMPQMQSVPQMQPMPQTQPFIHPQPSTHNNYYQGPTPKMSQMPPNAPTHSSQPMYPPQPTYEALQYYPSQQPYQAPQSMYPAHEMYNPPTYYQVSSHQFQPLNPYQMPPPPPTNPQDEVFEVPYILPDEAQNRYPRPVLPAPGGDAHSVPTASMPSIDVTTNPVASGSGSGSGSGYAKSSVSAPATTCGSWRGSDCSGGFDETGKGNEAKGKEVMRFVDAQDAEVQRNPEGKTQDPGQGPGQ